MPNEPSAAALVAVLSVAVLALYVLVKTLSALPCAALAGSVVLAAGPIWLFLTQRALLTRRAIIGSVGTDTGHIQRWFSAGNFIRILLVFVALGLAIVLLSLMTALRTAEWLILAADALLLGLIYYPIRQSLVSQIREEHRGLVTRLWPITLVNVVALMAAFVMLDLVSAHAVIQGTWSEVADEAFHRASQGVVCPGAGVLLGAVAALDQMVWKVAIESIPQLPDTATKFVSWVVFLVWTGFGAVLFTQFMLGVVALVEDRARQKAGKATSSTLWRTFILTILVLAVPYVYASWKLSQWKPSPPTTATDSTPTPADPCAASRFDATSLRATLSEDIDQARREAHQIADTRVDAALGVVFAKAGQGVDAYLDWYFSLYGDYSRLAAVMVGDLEQVMQDNLTKHVFNETGFAQVLESESLKIQQATLEQIVSAAGQLSGTVRAAVGANDCLMPNLDLSGLVNLEPDRLRATLSTTSAVTVAAVTAKALGKKAAAAAASKAAASGSMKMAAKIAGKVIAKKGTSAAAATLTGAVLCAPAGPAAIACGIVAGVITWVAVDKAAIEIEELVSRDQMRADLLGALQEQRRVVEQELKALHRGLADTLALDINARADKLFVPIRDGL